MLRALKMLVLAWALVVTGPNAWAWASQIAADGTPGVEANVHADPVDRPAGVSIIDQAAAQDGGRCRGLGDDGSDLTGVSSGGCGQPIATPRTLAAAGSCVLRSRDHQCVFARGPPVFGPL